MFKIGIGYDVHKLVTQRDLIIGGVKIEYEKGLLGHSDADVLTHAIMDAILGAAGEGDIGQHFPDTDPKYKGISSMELLSEVKNITEKKGYAISNIDCVIVAQAPKMAGHMKEMEKKLSSCLGGVDVNVKATTEEGLGFTGSGEGIAAKAVALLYMAQ